MIAAKNLVLITMEDFLLKYEGTRCQFHEGEVWDAQPNSPDHSYLQAAIAEVIRSFFNKSGGPKSPGGWWIFTEVAVKYGDRSLFSHDLSGWRRTRVPDRPKCYPVTERPDWVCEILSSNSARDLITKKKILFENEVPYYWIVNTAENILSVFEWTSKGYLSVLDVQLGFEGRIPPFDAVDLKLSVLFGEEDE